MGRIPKSFRGIRPLDPRRTWHMYIKRIEDPDTNYKGHIIMHYGKLRDSKLNFFLCIHLYKMRITVIGITVVPFSRSISWQKTINAVESEIKYTLNAISNTLSYCPSLLYFWHKNRLSGLQGNYILKTLQCKIECIIMLDLFQMNCVSLCHVTKKDARTPVMCAYVFWIVFSIVVTISF